MLAGGDADDPVIAAAANAQHRLVDAVQAVGAVGWLIAGALLVAGGAIGQWRGRTRRGEVRVAPGVQESRSTPGARADNPAIAGKFEGSGPIGAVICQQLRRRVLRHQGPAPARAGGEAGGRATTGTNPASSPFPELPAGVRGCSSASATVSSLPRRPRSSWGGGWRGVRRQELVRMTSCWVARVIAT